MTFRMVLRDSRPAEFAATGLYETARDRVAAINARH